LYKYKLLQKKKGKIKKNKYLFSCIIGTKYQRYQKIKGKIKKKDIYTCLIGKKYQEKSRYLFYIRIAFEKEYTIKFFWSGDFNEWYWKKNIRIFYNVLFHIKKDIFIFIYIFLWIVVIGTINISRI